MQEKKSRKQVFRQTCENHLRMPAIGEDAQLGPIPEEVEEHSARVLKLAGNVLEWGH